MKDKQEKMILKNINKKNYENIDEYIKNKGYSALKKVLKEMKPTDVIEEIKKSGLQGRAGAGYLVGLKWESAKNEKSKTKYVICNAHEGGKNFIIDKIILEKMPHLIIEAIEIAGYAVGADKGYICVKNSYTLAIERIENAINQANNKKILGKKIFNSSFDFNIELRIIEDNFIYGEETALVNFLETGIGEPKIKPPYLTENGLYGKPTVLNNVETLANIPIIINKGLKWFERTGDNHSNGTKIFSLTGNVKNKGLIEVPMGITLREIVYDLGGGIPNNRDFKAALIGGHLGGCIPKEHIDTPIDYRTLKSISLTMGAGELEILDDTNCMVNLTKKYIKFILGESCGKCTPCRIGTKRMYEILEKICNGDAEELDIYKLEKLATNIKATSICDLGKSSANIVLSTLKYFRNEYKEHVIYKQCKVGKCKKISQIKIMPELCKGCGMCQKNCPVNAIEGNGRDVRKINQDICIKCGTCLLKCPFNAII